MNVNLTQLVNELSKIEDDQIEEFQKWLQSYLTQYAKENTDKDQHLNIIFKKLKETTLWDVEESVEHYFSYKIRGYKVQDVQCFIMPICTKWKSTIKSVATKKLLSDPKGLSFESYYHAQEIQPISGLYLGSRLAGQDYFWLKSQGITNILSVAVNLVPLYPQEFKYKVIEIWDGEHVSVGSYFDAVTEWMDKALQNGKILVHW